MSRVKELWALLYNPETCEYELKSFKQSLADTVKSATLNAELGDHLVCVFSSRPHIHPNWAEFVAEQEVKQN